MFMLKYKYKNKVNEEHSEQNPTSVNGSKTSLHRCLLSRCLLTTCPSTRPLSGCTSAHPWVHAFSQFCCPNVDPDTLQVFLNCYKTVGSHAFGSLPPRLFNPFWGLLTLYAKLFLNHRCNTDDQLEFDFPLLYLCSFVDNCFFIAVEKSDFVAQMLK